MRWGEHVEKCRAWREKRAYIARLLPGPRGHVQREFGTVKSGKKNQRQLYIACRPGEVFEARRWRWTGFDHVVGTVWFGVTEDHCIAPLTREEAFASLYMQALAPPSIEAGSMTATSCVERMPIAGVWIADVE